MATLSEAVLKNLQENDAKQLKRYPDSIFECRCGHRGPLAEVDRTQHSPFTVCWKIDGITGG